MRHKNGLNSVIVGVREIQSTLEYNPRILKLKMVSLRAVLKALFPRVLTILFVAKLCLKASEFQSDPEIFWFHCPDNVTCLYCPQGLHLASFVS